MAMRIEYEGVIEQQPAYSHVGYTAAAFTTNEYVHGGSRREMTAWAGVAILGLALVLMAGRRWRFAGAGRGAVTLGVIGLGLLAGGISMGVMRTLPTGEMTPEFHATLVALERLVAETDAWVAAHGRPPTEDEWMRMHPVAPRDGWGHPLEYHAGERGLIWWDKRGYRIVSLGRLRGKSDQIVWDIPSEWLGRDGRFGTADDGPELAAGLEGVDLSRYGRAVR